MLGNIRRNLHLIKKSLNSFGKLSDYGAVNFIFSDIDSHSLTFHMNI